MSKALCVCVCVGVHLGLKAPRTLNIFNIPLALSIFVCQQDKNL